jgi:hypothetical protein
MARLHSYVWNQVSNDVGIMTAVGAIAMRKEHSSRDLGGASFNQILMIKKLEKIYSHLGDDEDAFRVNAATDAKGVLQKAYRLDGFKYLCEKLGINDKAEQDLFLQNNGGSREGFVKKFKDAFEHANKHNSLLKLNLDFNGLANKEDKEREFKGQIVDEYNNARQGLKNFFGGKTEQLKTNDDVLKEYGGSVFRDNKATLAEIGDDIKQQPNAMMISKMAMYRAKDEESRVSLLHSHQPSFDVDGAQV